MTEDQRAQLRVNVVTFKVRYKSATVDEFKERHRLEVSPQGIFVQTAKPLAIGTMVKFDVQLASRRAVLRGAGCVVWSRDAEHSSPPRPPGMGVRFIEVDGPSQALIDDLVSGGADAGLAYEEPLLANEEPLEDATIVQPARSPARPAASTPPVPGAPTRRPTLMGIGGSPTSMFPEMTARAEMPSQSDPTMIEEMSELLDTELSEEATLTATISQQFFSRPVGVVRAPAEAPTSTGNGVDHSADTLQEPLLPDLHPASVVRTPEKSRARKARTGRGMRAWLALTLLTAVVLSPASHSRKVFRGATATTASAAARAAESGKTPAEAASRSSTEPPVASESRASEGSTQPPASSSAAPATELPVAAMSAPGPKVVSTDRHASPAPSTRAPRPSAKGAAPVLTASKRRWRPASPASTGDDNPY